MQLANTSGNSTGVICMYVPRADVNMQLPVSLALYHTETVTDLGHFFKVNSGKCSKEKNRFMTQH